MIIVFSKRFRKEIEKAKHTYLISKIKELIAIVKKNPFQNPPPYEKLKGCRMLISDGLTNSIGWCMSSILRTVKLNLRVVGDIMSKKVSVL